MQPVLQMIITNLRNRPLTHDLVQSMQLTIPSLYHNFITGSKDFPVIAVRGFLNSLLLDIPFKSWTENTKPSRFMLAPAGLMVPPAGSSLLPDILTPALPEKTEVGVLKADRRNVVRTMSFQATVFTRVISLVYSLETTELPNLWRVTDYTTDGKVLMSVLCWFTGKMGEQILTKIPRKRRNREEDGSSGGSSSSSSSNPFPPRKRLRL